MIQPARKSAQSIGKKMTALQKMSFMGHIRAELGLDIVETINEKRYIGAKIYREKREILDRFANGKCISCYTMAPSDPRHQHFVFVPYQESLNKFRVVIFQYDAANIRTNGFGLSNTTFVNIPTDETAPAFLKSELDGNVVQYGLMCPAGRHSPSESYYSIVTHEWLALRSDGLIGESELCKELFDQSNLGLPNL